MQNFEFKPVNLGQLFVAVMMDGKWYTRTLLLKRVKGNRGTIHGTLERLRVQGYLVRAYNPAYKGVNPNRGEGIAVYSYKWTGKFWYDSRVGSTSPAVAYYGKLRYRMSHCRQYSSAARELCS